MYVWNLLVLWAARKISFPILCYAIYTRPLVIEGKCLAYVVDCTVDELIKRALKKRKQLNRPLCLKQATLNGTLKVADEYRLAKDRYGMVRFALVAQDNSDCHKDD